MISYLDGSATTGATSDVRIIYVIDHEHEHHFPVDVTPLSHFLQVGSWHGERFREWRDIDLAEVCAQPVDSHEPTRPLVRRRFARTGGRGGEGFRNFAKVS